MGCYLICRILATVALISHEVLAQSNNIQQKGATCIESCPQGQAYDIGESSCYPLYESGPCGSLAIFAPMDSNPLFGECKCNTLEGPPGHPLTYWPDFGLCFQLFTQGPCSDGEWLEPIRNVTSTCVRNPCLGYSQDSNIQKYTPAGSFDFVYLGRCYKTETKAFCGKDNEVARFPAGSNVPACIDANQPIEVAQLSVLGPADCPKGQVPDSVGDCVPSINFQ